jgi:hypothetical protein
LVQLIWGSAETQSQLDVADPATFGAD